MKLQRFKRNISLYKLGLTKLDEDEKLVYNYLKSRLSGLICYECSDCPGSFFLGVSPGDIIFEYVLTTHKGNIKYNYIDILIRMKHDEQNEIKNIIRWWLAEKMNIKLNSLHLGDPHSFEHIGKSFVMKERMNKSI